MSLKLVVLNAKYTCTLHGIRQSNYKYNYKDYLNYLNMESVLEFSANRLRLIPASFTTKHGGKQEKIPY